MSGDTKDPVEQILYERGLRVLRDLKMAEEIEADYRERLAEAGRRFTELTVERLAIEQHMREQGWTLPVLVQQKVPTTLMTKADPPLTLSDPS